MSESVVTKYKDVCLVCGRPREGDHHLIFGTSERKLSEEDGLKIPVCNNCHNIGSIPGRIHENPMAEKLSKMLGQAIWEKEWMLKKIEAGNKDSLKDTCRGEFMKRYRKSYL